VHASGLDLRLQNEDIGVRLPSCTPIKTFNNRRSNMKRFQKIIGGFQKIINKLDELKAKCDKKAMKIALKVDKLHEKRVGQIREGMLAKTAADNLKDIFPKAPAKKS